MLCEIVNIGNNLGGYSSRLTVPVLERAADDRHQEGQRRGINVVDEFGIEDSLKGSVQNGKRGGYGT